MEVPYHGSGYACRGRFAIGLRARPKWLRNPGQMVNPYQTGLIAVQAEKNLL